jgi:hypothetical protein
MGWLVLVLHIILLIVPPSVMTWKLLGSISAHSVCFSGLRVHESTGVAANRQIRYLFSIQNNEDVALTGKRILKIRILDNLGRFAAGKDPEVYAGCNPLRVLMSADRTVWCAAFDELPALETWTIRFTTDGEGRNIRMTLEDADPAEAKKPSPAPASTKKPGPSVDLPVLSHTQLTLPADRESVFKGRYATPEAWWSFTASSLALGGYFVSVLYYVCGRDLTQITWVDTGLACLIVVFGCTLWWLTRRPAPSISQGYREPSETRPFEVIPATVVVVTPPPAAP